MKSLIEKLLREKQFYFLSDKFSVNYLSKGAYNTMYVISSGKENKKFVIRINTHQDEFSGSGMESEFKVLSSLPEGIAPKPYVVDVSKKYFPYSYMIQSFVSGKHPTKFSLKLLSQLAKKMSLIHSINLSKCGIFPGKFEKYSLIRLLKPYFKRAETHISEIRNLMNSAKKYVEYHDKKNPLKKFSLIHYDVHYKNLIYDGKEVYFLDWEFAESGDPAMDIAMLFWYSTLFDSKIKLTELQKAHFIKEYKKLANGGNIEKRIKIQEPIVVLIQLLWLKSQIKNWEALPQPLSLEIKQQKLDYEQSVKIALDFLNKHRFNIGI